jgi:hypothetical protein
MTIQTTVVAPARRPRRIERFRSRTAGRIDPGGSERYGTRFDVDGRA